MEFIRTQVEPEVKDDETSLLDLYGHTKTIYSYKSGFSGMPLVWGDHWPFTVDEDGGRVMLLGA